MGSLVIVSTQDKNWWPVKRNQHAVHHNNPIALLAFLLKGKYVTCVNEISPVKLHVLLLIIHSQPKEVIFIYFFLI